jgi:hypothetical protein
MLCSEFWWLNDFISWLNDFMSWLNDFMSRLNAKTCPIHEKLAWLEAKNS